MCGDIYKCEATFINVGQTSQMGKEKKKKRYDNRNKRGREGGR